MSKKDELQAKREELQAHSLETVNRLSELDSEIEAAIAEESSRRIHHGCCHGCVTEQRKCYKCKYYGPNWEMESLKTRAGESKPKMRLGDFYYKGGHGKPMQVTKAGIYSEMIDEYGVVHRGKGDRYELATPIINGFDEMTAMQENVTEFKIEGDQGGVLSISTSHEAFYSDVTITIGTEDIRLMAKDYPAFELKVKQFGATMKRSQQ